MKQDTESGWRANPVMVSREKNAGLADIEKKARLDQVVVDDWGNNGPRSDFTEAARNDSKVANFDFAEAARNDSRVANTSFSTTLHEKLINKQKSNNIDQNENKKVKNYKIKNKVEESLNLGGDTQNSLVSALTTGDLVSMEEPVTVHIVVQNEDDGSDSNNEGVVKTTVGKIEENIRMGKNEVQHDQHRLLVMDDGVNAFDNNEKLQDSSNDNTLENNNDHKSMKGHANWTFENHKKEEMKKMEIMLNPGGLVDYELYHQETLSMKELEDVFGEGLVPELFTMSNKKKKIFMTKDHNIGYQFLSARNPLPNAKDDEGATTRMKHAHQFSILMGCPNRKSMVQQLKTHKEWPFDIKDYDKAKEHYGYVLEHVGNVSKTRSKQRDKPPHTTVPGEILCIDLKQVGYLADGTAHNVIHAVCMATGVAHAEEVIDSNTNAMIAIINHYKALGYMSKIDGAGTVKQIWSDRDLQFKRLKPVFLRRYKVLLRLSQVNYSQRRCEASIQQTDKRLQRCMAALPVRVTPYIAAQMWIGITSVQNYMIHYPHNITPIEKYTGARPNLCDTNWLNVGQLVMFRRESTECKKIGKKDAMVGIPSARMGLLTGIPIDYPTARNVLVFRNGKISESESKIEVVGNPKLAPMDVNLFPTSLRRAKDVVQADIHQHLFPFQLEQAALPKPVARLRQPKAEEVWDDADWDDILNNDIDDADIASRRAKRKIDKQSPSVTSVDTVVDTKGDNEESLEGIVKTSQPNPIENENKSRAGRLRKPKVMVSKSTNSVPTDSTITSEQDIYGQSEGAVSEAEAIVRRELRKLLLVKYGGRDVTIDYGRNWNLELYGDRYYLAPHEVTEIEEFRKEIELELKEADMLERRDNICPDLCKAFEEILKLEDNETVKKVLITSANMSPKKAAQQQDPDLVRAAAKSILAEKNNLLENKVLEFMAFTDIPPGYRNKILNSFVFVVNKYSANNDLIKAKSRMVVGGNTMTPEQHGRTAAPVTSKTILFLLFQLLCEDGMKAVCMDVGQAFCRVPLVGNDMVNNEDIYIRVDPSMQDGTSSTKYARLLKALYGIKNASYLWYLEVKQLLVDKCGFTCSSVDGALFVKHDDEGHIQMVLALHVDDTFLLYRNEEDMKMVYDNMVEKFEDVSLGGTDSFCGFCIEKNEVTNTVTVTQKGYLSTLGDELQIEAEIAKYKTKHWQLTPWDGQAATTGLGQKEEKVNVTKYQQLVGLINYAVQLRSDVQIMASMLSTRNQDPRLDDWIRAVRVVWYLRNTADLGATFKPIERINGKINLYATADGSYALRRDGEGVTGVTVSLGPNGTPFSTICKKQSTASRSSTEAEVKAWNVAAAHLSYLKKVMRVVLGYEIDPIIVETDNMGANINATAVAICKNLRHMDAKIFYCRQMYQQREVVFCWTHTSGLLADMFTKPLEPKHFFEFRARLLGEDCSGLEDSLINRNITFPNNHVQSIYGNIEECCWTTQ